MLELSDRLKKSWEITVDRRAPAGSWGHIANVIWRIARRVGLAMVIAIGVLSLPGYTPATAPDLHILFSSLGIIGGNNTIARIRARRRLVWAVPMSRNAHVATTAPADHRAIRRATCDTSACLRPISRRGSSAYISSSRFRPLTGS